MAREIRVVLDVEDSDEVRPVQLIVGLLAGSVAPR